MANRGFKLGMTAFSMMLTGVSGAFAQTAPAASGGASSSADAVNGGAGIELIVVTATKRAQNIQDVPFTVSALSQADLTARGAQTIDQAISYVPGVSFTSNGTNSGAYTIRGVNTGTYIAGTQSPVALYIDDLNILDPFYPKVTPSLRLFDINRVEVLEGPQGTLFGSGSIGGAIRLISNKPNLTDYQAETEDTVFGTEGGAVSYDTNLMANIPIVSGELALRVVGYYDQDGGYIDNTARNERDANRAVSEGGRVQLEYTPNSDLTLIASAMFDSGRPHNSAFSFYNNKKYQWDGLIANTNTDRTDIYSLTGTYNFGWSNLTSITTYADRYENIQADFSTDVHLLLEITDPSPVNDYGPSRTFSQEIRLASEDSGRFKWLIGGIYIDNHRTVIEPIDVPGSGAFFGVASDIVSLSNDRVGIREEALFGEMSYNIFPDLTATAGVRVFEDRLSKVEQIGGTLEPASSSSTVVKEIIGDTKIQSQLPPEF